MRRLPIFFVLDVSESMIGDNIKKLEDGLNSIVKSLRQDPHALETVYLSVITFAGKAKTIVPLIEISSYYSPKLSIGGGTSLGSAIFHLMGEIDKTVVKTTFEKKGDWKPIVYLITDGTSTDNTNQAITKWKAEYSNRVTLVALALGKFADLEILKSLTEHALLLENTKDDDFKKFIKWVTDSVKTQSQSVSDNPTTHANLAPIDESYLSIIKDIKNLKLIDPNFVILTGRCQTTTQPYLIKYEKNIQTVEHQDFKTSSTHYQMTGCYSVEEEYFGMSDGDLKLKVNTSELLGVPSCTHCANPTALAVCSCEGILCIKGEGLAKCPWCKKDVNFSFSSSNGEGFDINRARG